jgi:hypothetical protein
LVRRGLKTDRKYLFVIDDSKALHAAIDTVFSVENPVQRCRHHKVENVMGYLPEHLKEQTKAAMRSAFRLPAKEGMARLEKQAEWLEREYPSAAVSLREGLAEMFTVTRLGFIAGLGPMLGFNQRDREPAQWCTVAHPQGLPLARREDGAALGRRSPAHDRTKLSQDYGLPGSVDAESCVRSERGVGSTGGGVE